LKSTATNVNDLKLKLGLFVLIEGLVISASFLGRAIILKGVIQFSQFFADAFWFGSFLCFCLYFSSIIHFSLLIKAAGHKSGEAYFRKAYSETRRFAIAAGLVVLTSLFSIHSTSSLVVLLIPPLAVLSYLFNLSLLHRP